MSHDGDDRRNHDHVIFVACRHHGLVRRKSLFITLYRWRYGDRALSRLKAEVLGNQRCLVVVNYLVNAGKDAVLDQSTNYLVRCRVQQVGQVFDDNLWWNRNWPGWFLFHCGCAPFLWPLPVCSVATCRACSTRMSLSPCPIATGRRTALPVATRARSSCR